MQVRIAHDAPAATRTGALVVPVCTDAVLDEAVKAVDDALGGTIAQILSSGEITGKFGETSLIHAPGQPFGRVLVVGLGERDKVESYMLARYTGVAVRLLGRKNISEIAVILPQLARGNEVAAASFVAEGAINASFETTLYQEKPEKKLTVTSVTILSEGFDKDALARGLERGTALGEAITIAKTLAVTPANDMTPTHLANAAQKVAKDTGLEIDVLDEERARKEGMGSFLSVAAGSAQPPKFIVLTYKGDPSSKEVLAFVGKGITFDTGGISIKPAERMEEMKYDMSGGAGTIATMYAIGKLKPKINVIGLVPATENMPSGKATKPGDIVKAMNGTTIEVINTDAEGRLILCDALTYAKKLGATKIIDSATLTGACVVALGHSASAAISNNDSFVQQFLTAAKHTGERYWQLPLYDDYTQAMKSDIADLKNSGGRAAGTCTAAAFLGTFVGDTPWIHLDIAGTAYLDKEFPWQAKGPTGTPVRAYISFIETLTGNHVLRSTANGTAKVGTPA